MLRLDRSSQSGGLQTQLLQQLRELIGSGRIAPMSRMPATRALARQMGISRTTAMLVYEELIAEGYLQTKPAAGTFVSTRPPGGPQAPRSAVPSTQTGCSGQREFDRAGDASSRSAKPALDFRSGGCDFRLFPVRTWLRVVSRTLRDVSADLADDHPAGSSRLRTAIAAWMLSERGVPVRADEVIIVSSIRQACYILARLLLDRDASVLVDAHLPRTAARLFDSIGVSIERMHSAGPGIPDGRDRHPLAWLNAPHPHATAEFSRRWWQRREMLLDWSRRSGAHLVEYEGVDHILFLAPPVDGGSRSHVIRAGALSPTLGLGTRMGYMIVPPTLVDAVTSLKEALGGAPPPLEQGALARFIEDGSYSRHLRRVGKVMTERRAALIGGLRSCFGTATIEEPTAEDQLCWSFPGDASAAEAIHSHARVEGIALDLVEHGITGATAIDDRALFLSYARMNEHQITVGVRKLAAIIDDIRHQRGTRMAAARLRPSQHLAGCD